MGNLASVTINDEEATVHTFVPQSNTGGKVTWVATSATLPAAYQEVLTLRLRPVNGSDPARIDWGIKVPVAVVNADTGLYELSHINRASGTYMFAPESVQQERLNLRMMVDNLHLEAVFKDAVEDLEAAY